MPLSSVAQIHTVVTAEIGIAFVDIALIIGYLVESEMSWKMLWNNVKAISNNP
jgi:hypothetical protein